MNTARTILVLLVLILALPSCASNRVKGLEELDFSVTPERRAEGFTRLMTDALSLGADQIGPVGDINLRYAEGVEWVAQSRADARTRSYQLRDVRGRRDADLRGVLTTPQFRHFVEIREALRKQLVEQLEDEAKAKGKSP